jgi:CCR4-NOT transcription complex subunit 1
VVLIFHCLADAILSTNFPTFVNIISRPDYGRHDDLTPTFIAAIVDRYIQGHPPNFNAAAKSELMHKVRARWTEQPPPLEVLASLDLIRVLGERSPSALALYIQRTGADFTSDEETCLGYLENRPSSIQPTAEQVSSALTYTTISQTPEHNPSVLVAALRRILPPAFNWQDVVAYFDQRDARVSPGQFLRLFNALLPVAQVQSQDPDLPALDIQYLWGGIHWENPETQLSFICAYASLTPEQLDASTIPRLHASFTIDEFAQSSEDVRERATVAAKHPLISVAALSAIFQIALHSQHASQTIEAMRLFQEVVVPNLDIFIVSAFGVAKPWPSMAVDTLVTLFDTLLRKLDSKSAFVMDSLWRRDKDWVRQRLIQAHADHPLDLPFIFEQAVKHNWLDDLVYLPNGFGYDLAALAHAEGYLDLQQWARNNAERGTEISRSLLQFLMIKANMELQFQRPPDGQPQQKNSTTLQVKTVSAMLQILEDFMPKAPVHELIVVQRHCIIVYPRLINYGEGFDDIIDANGKIGNSLPPQANVRMEEHYKTMYGNETQVKDIVEILNRYKHSRDPLEQDVFACMIHGLFDEYSHYIDYPLEALATTAVLFGGIISHKLISDLPLKIGLGMILEAVRDHLPEDSMYKFGLQALMQLFGRFREWPGFCKQLTQIPGLQGTEAWKKASDVVKDHDEEIVRGQNGTTSGAHPGSEPMVNGNVEDSLGMETHAAPFSSINIDLPAPHLVFEEPAENIRDAIQFGLNNLTSAKLQGIFTDIQQQLEERHKQWFATHLVEERAKMQPNYHQVYLDFVRLFQDKALSTEVLRQTYISVARMLNSESTMQNSTERTHLKHLGAWLGLLTIARDQPIKHRNIAFKQLLVEAYDTKRLIVVIPFVCKVLIQGARSTVYRPPNPWLMDILHLLIELYHNGELKLNLKFEIEVLCKDLNLDHKSIEPSQELSQHRAQVDDVAEMAVPDPLEPFENLSLNGMAGGIATGLSPHPPVLIPDLGPQLQIPPVNEMVASTSRLHEIVRTALTRALQDIIQPVVDRSVTIAAISTAQMIHKDFQIEPDEAKVRNAAITMVKATAGSLALVTSKEPLRANITNYMRNLSSDLQQQLPEGTLIMCVNSNLELACKVIENHAEERAVPEIEEMIEPELESRRRHRLQRPNEPYMDPNLSRWAMTIPNPYKLSPNMNGLNAEQLAIYEEFGRQSRAAAPASQAHAATASDATRNIANEVLQDQYSSVPNLPTPAETPSLPHLQTQIPYQHVQPGMTNGRPSAHPSQQEARVLMDRVQKFLVELQRASMDSREEHFTELPRPHQVLDAVDALTQLIIRTSQNSEEFAIYAAEKICQQMFAQVDHAALFLESLVHVLELLLKISAGSGTGLHDRVHAIFSQQPPQNFLNLPLITALLRTDLLNLQVIDVAMSNALAQREEGSLEFFERLWELMLGNEKPVALYGDFIGSLAKAWPWIHEEPELEASQRLRAKIQGSGIPIPTSQAVEKQDQFDYVFEEWVRLDGNLNAPEKAVTAFAKQILSKGIITSKEDFLHFLRTAIDTSVAMNEQVVHTGGNSGDVYAGVDALVKLISIFAKENIVQQSDPSQGAVAVLDAALNIGILTLNHHHITRGEHFNQRVFFRFFSLLIHQADDIFGPSTPGTVLGEDGVEIHRRDFLLRVAATFQHIGPARFPGFAFAWLDLIQHRRFLVDLMTLEGKRGWGPFTKIVVLLLRHVSEYLKIVDVPDVAREFIRAATKLMVIIEHDYPDFLAANHVRFCANIPPHAAQLRNLILHAQPRQEASETQESLPNADDYDLAATYLQENGLLELVDQLLQDGPSEDAIANLTHEINKNDAGNTVFGNVRVSTNTALVDAVVLFIGSFAVKRNHEGGSLFVPGAADVATLSLLTHELGPEPRYFFLSSIVDELRYPGPYTTYYGSVLLELWGQDATDPEEIDIRQQLVRIILERFSGYWPQPWGLMYVVMELTKKDKYMFFDQPFIKADRDVADRFQAIYHTVDGLA